MEKVSLFWSHVLFKLERANVYVVRTELLGWHFLENKFYALQSQDCSKIITNGKYW